MNSSCSGAVGDGPQAEANGDVGFYETRLVPEGRVLLVDFIDVGEDAVIDATLLNSGDHGDRWGDKNVARVVVGGSIEEVAQSIDPGNTETEETALVLLDVMSGPAGSSASINSYEVAEGASKAAFVGFTLGHIAAHEIGHVAHQCG